MKIRIPGQLEPTEGLRDEIWFLFATTTAKYSILESCNKASKWLEIQHSQPHLQLSKSSQGVTGDLKHSQLATALQLGGRLQFPSQLVQREIQCFHTSQRRHVWQCGQLVQ